MEDMYLIGPEPHKQQIWPCEHKQHQHSDGSWCFTGRVILFKGQIEWIWILLLYLKQTMKFNIFVFFLFRAFVSWLANHHHC